TAVVSYGGNLAHYTITPENNGIYNARLQNFEGGEGPVPPLRITLVRGVRHWVGSFANAYIVNELGKAIDGRVRGANPHAL
ncbi:MAG TPA: hypothetical protein VGE06_00700, partial [Flavisolibacter sp.]